MDFADLAFAGAARQANLLRARELSSRELVEGYLARIEKLDPTLNAFRLVYLERALAEAEQADARLRAGDERPLLGVPVAVKDNVDVAGDVSCFGTRSPRAPVNADSEVVRRLRGAGAARGEPGRLRIAFSPQPPIAARMADSVVRALHGTADLLRSLGHEVVEHEPDYGEIRTLFGPRWVRGICDDSRELVAGTGQLERRTRQMAALGRITSPALVERARRGEAALVARLAPTFDRFDVLLTPALAAPPVEAGRWEGLGALRTFLGVAAWTPGTAAWNITGQPAAAVPAGFTDDGLPLSVQLVGRTNDENTLLSLR